jgi:hypothetical protein
MRIDPVDDARQTPVNRLLPDFFRTNFVNASIATFLNPASGLENTQATQVLLKHLPRS